MDNRMSLDLLHKISRILFFPRDKNATLMFPVGSGFNAISPDGHSYTWQFESNPQSEQLVVSIIEAVTGFKFTMTAEEANYHCYCRSNQPLEQ